MLKSSELQELEMMLQAMQEFDFFSDVESPEIPPREQLPFPVMPGYGAGVSVRDYFQQMETYAMHMHGIQLAVEQTPPVVPPAAARNYAQYALGQASLGSLCEDLD